MIDKNKLVKFGECNKPHGIKGGFSFYLYNSENSHLEKGSDIYLYPLDSKSSIGNEGEKHKIDSISFGNKTICYLKGITDRNIVESMLPYEIYFEKDKLKDLDEDEFYLEDLKGLEVRDFDTKEEVGKVLSFYESGETVILVIRTKDEKLELPFVKSFFPEVNFEEKFILLKKFEVFSER